MSHYYINDETLSSEKNKIKTKLLGEEMIFYTQAGVFSKDAIDFGSRMLINNVQIRKNDRILVDVGCGYGPIGLSLAKSNRKLSVHMLDINERAINLAKLNASENKVDNVNIKENDLLEGFDITADIIVTNPPIRTGKKNIFKLYEQAYENLKEGGRFYCVIQRKQGAPSTEKKLKELYGNCTAVIKDRGYWVLMSIKEKTID